jgi:hypothetical protein
VDARRAGVGLGTHFNMLVSFFRSTHGLESTRHILPRRVFVQMRCGES